jgi:hypothetical protein
MASDIYKFSLGGQVSDTGKLISLQYTLEEQLLRYMRGEGFVPVLDITPIAETAYDPANELFNFELTVYGVEAECPADFEGWLNGQLIPSTPKDRSEQS